MNSYLEFKNEVLPRIRDLGYNAVQIMAIQEHAYYGSFGYHVTNFFAVRCLSGFPVCCIIAGDTHLLKVTQISEQECVPFD